MGKNNLGREVLYINSMRQVSAAFLYGSEILFIVTLISGFFMQTNFDYWLGWLIIITAITIFIGIAYESYESRYWRILNSFVKLYRTDSNQAVTEIYEAF